MSAGITPPQTHGSIMSFLRELAEIQSTGGRSGAAAGAGLVLLLGTWDDELEPARDGAAGSGEAPFGGLGKPCVPPVGCRRRRGLFSASCGLGAFSPQPHCGVSSATAWTFDLTRHRPPALHRPHCGLISSHLDPSGAARQAPVSRPLQLVLSSVGAAVAAAAGAGIGVDIGRRWAVF
jgi:hypothetical protein